MGQGNSFQLLVQLLRCILIARGANVEQKQRQRYLELVNIAFPPLQWRLICHHLLSAPGLREAKICPRLHHCKTWCCGNPAAASNTAGQVGRLKGIQHLT